MHTQFWLDLVDSESLYKLSFGDGMILKDMLLGTSCEDVISLNLCMVRSSGDVGC